MKFCNVTPFRIQWDPLLETLPHSLLMRQQMEMIVFVHFMIAPVDVKLLNKWSHHLRSGFTETVVATRKRYCCNICVEEAHVVYIA